MKTTFATLASDSRYVSILSTGIYKRCARRDRRHRQNVATRCEAWATEFERRSLHNARRDTVVVQLQAVTGPEADTHSGDSAPVAASAHGRVVHVTFRRKDRSVEHYDLRVAA